MLLLSDISWLCKSVSFFTTPNIFFRPTCLENQVTISEFSALFDAEIFNSIWKYQTDNTFLYADFTNVTSDIFGHASCPGETLHGHLLGIMQYQVECLLRIVGNESRQKLSKTTELDELHAYLTMLSRRQSTRPLLSCSVFGGFSDNNKVECGEIFNNWAILLLMAYTSLGEESWKWNK